MRQGRCLSCRRPKCNLVFKSLNSKHTHVTVESRTPLNHCYYYSRLHPTPTETTRLAASITTLQACQPAEGNQQQPLSTCADFLTAHNQHHSHSTLFSSFISAITGTIIGLPPTTQQPNSTKPKSSKWNPILLTTTTLVDPQSLQYPKTSSRIVECWSCFSSLNICVGACTDRKTVSRFSHTPAMLSVSNSSSSSLPSTPSKLLL